MANNVNPSVTVPGQPVDASLVSYTHIIYALHSLSVLIGLTSAWTIVGSFIFGLPSIIAVIMNYARRSDVRGTWLESHFRWQIRTFWFGLLWVTLCVLFIVGTLGIGLIVSWLPRRRRLLPSGLTPRWARRASSRTSPPRSPSRRPCSGCSGAAR